MFTRNKAIQETIDVMNGKGKRAKLKLYCKEFLEDIEDGFRLKELLCYNWFASILTLIMCNMIKEWTGSETLWLFIIINASWLFLTVMRIPRDDGEWREWRLFFVPIMLAVICLSMMRLIGDGAKGFWIGIIVFISELILLWDIRRRENRKGG